MLVLLNIYENKTVLNINYMQRLPKPNKPDGFCKPKPKTNKNKKPNPSLINPVFFTRTQRYENQQPEPYGVGISNWNMKTPKTRTRCILNYYIHLMCTANDRQSKIIVKNE